MVLSMGKHYLEDVLTTIGAYVDVLKFAGGSFSLMPRSAKRFSMRHRPASFASSVNPGTNGER
jgi:phosphosulfolactate synthase (CoM biosynthesis protein A)